MKQLLAKKGIVMPFHVPEPVLRDGFVKIDVLYSCISVGTEISGVKESGKSIINRALENPKKIVQALEIVKQKGFSGLNRELTALKEELRGIGYSISGVVSDIGNGVEGFQKGDMVSAGGAGFAFHAEQVIVPKNLVVKVPSGLSSAFASTGTVGSIALHGVRRADLRIGELAVVLGTGLLGLISIQILVSSGIRVAAIDIDPVRLELAKKLGAEIVINSKEENPVLVTRNWTNGNGVDTVLFTAATASSIPLSQSFNMCRKKGKVVLVGVSGMEINRSDIYKNEIDFIISSSYGPGRYDESYELEGHDYPYPYVRWTENRNIEEYLRLINNGKINLEALNPEIIDINETEAAYKKIENSGGSILTILKFEDNKRKPIETKISLKAKKLSKEKVNIGVIGAGGFAISTILPIITELSSKFSIKTIVNRTGSKAINIANQFNVQDASADPNDILNDKDIDLVVISTRHANHAELVLEALKRNKHVFVEKPLATTQEQLDEIEIFYKNNTNENLPILMVGYNRRFSIYAEEIKKHIKNRIGPLVIHYRMNAGFIPYDSWVHNDGGRIVGEACHIIDLMQFLTNSKIIEVNSNEIKPQKGIFKKTDNKSITFIFEDGSMGVLDYFSNGSKELSKEFMEIHFDNKSILMDDYKSIQSFGFNMTKIENKTSNKGHKEEWISVFKAIKNGQWPISLEDLLNNTHSSIIAYEM